MFLNLLEVGHFYWVGQQVQSGFSIRSYEKNLNLLANPIYCSSNITITLQDSYYFPFIDNETGTERLNNLPNSMQPKLIKLEFSLGWTDSKDHTSF